jgi:hypothetical protein
MNQILPWTTVAAFIIIAATLSVIGLIVASTQIIIKKLKKKDE